MTKKEAKKEAAAWNKRKTPVKMKIAQESDGNWYTYLVLPSRR